MTYEELYALFKAASKCIGTSEGVGLSFYLLGYPEYEAMLKLEEEFDKEE
jgi:hypothetical protein